MSIDYEAHKLATPARIDLFALDLNPIGIGQVYYFYPGTDASSHPVVYQGDTYTPWYIKLTGLDKRGTGSSPRPVATVGNPGQAITNLCRLYQDLVDAQVRRRRTLASYVTGNIASYIDEYYFIEQRSNETLDTVEFILAGGLDFLDKQLPGKLALNTACTHQYKSTANGSGCGWPGTDSTKWFDANGNPVTNVNQDACGYRISDCKLRFGANNPLDYGGNPGLGRSGI